MQHNNSFWVPWLHSFDCLGLHGICLIYLHHIKLNFFWEKKKKRTWMSTGTAQIPTWWTSRSSTRTTTQLDRSRFQGGCRSCGKLEGGTRPFSKGLFWGLRDVSVGMEKQKQQSFTHLLCNELHYQPQHVCADTAEIAAPKLETDGHS